MKPLRVQVPLRQLFNDVRDVGVVAVGQDLLARKPDSPALIRCRNRFLASLSLDQNLGFEEHHRGLGHLDDVDFRSGNERKLSEQTVEF